MLEFQVIHQKIIRADNFFVVADSKNYLKASFSFTSEWTGSITAVFQLKGQQEGYYQVLDENNTCFVPWEVLSEACGFYVSVFCGDLITANKVFIPVNASGMINGTTPAEPTPDVYTQILDIAEEAENIAQSVRRDADEGLFDGKPGEPGTTDYNDLENKPDLSIYVEKDELKTINGESLLGEGNIEIIATVEWGDIEGTLSNQPDLQTALNDKADKSTTLAGYGITNAYTKTETEEKISDYALSVDTKYGANLSLTVNTSTYVLTAQLKDQNGDNLGSAQTVDLPLESVVVGGAYDDTTKKVKLTLQNGSTVEFSVADLVAGLQTEITASNKLNADLVDDSTSVNKFVTTSEKTTWDNKQNAISDLATIRSGASLGSTAVQPSQLATVATSGSYNDLSDKPTIPTVLETFSNPDVSTVGYLGQICINKTNKEAYCCVSTNEEYTNYEVIGSPTISNGNLSNMSASKYINATILFKPLDNDWEIKFKFTTASTVGDLRFLGSPASGTTGLVLGTGSSRMRPFLKTEGSGSWNIVDGTLGSTTLSTNTTYWCKFQYKNGVYAIYLSTNGVDYNLDWSYSSNLKIGNITRPLSLCVDGGGSFNGVIDLKETEFIINNEIVWKPIMSGGYEWKQITNKKIDTVPTSGSTNAISSGAVYSLVGNIETALNTINSGV